MSFLSYFRAAAVAVALSVAAMPALAQSLTTTYQGGNGQNGNMFDLTPAVDLTVNSFDVHLPYTSEQSEGPVTIEVYWRTGTVENNQYSTAGWALLGSAEVAPQGFGNATPVPIGGLGLSAGQTYGIYVRTVGCCDMEYTDGADEEAPVVVSNSELTLTSFYGIQNGEESVFPVSNHFFPRLWNGTVYYTAGLEPATTCASEGYKGTKLTWCKNICENGLSGATLDIWIHRWINRYRDLPYCAAEGGGGETPALK